MQNSGWRLPGVSAPQAPADSTPSDLAQPSVQAVPDIIAEPVPPASLPPVKVGLLLPLSGQGEALGRAMLQSAQLALFDMNYGTMELMPRDTSNTAQGGRAAAEAAIRDGAQILIGPFFSANVQGAKPVAASANVQMVAFSTDWNQAGGHGWLMGFMPFEQVERIAQYAASRGVQRVAILAPEGDYGDAVISAYNAYTRRMNLPAPSVARLPADRNAMEDAVRRFARADERAQNPAAPMPYDAVLLPMGGAQLVAVSNMLTHFGMGPDRVRRLGTGLWDDSNLAREAALRGGWYAAPQPDQRRAFERRYFETYGEPPPRLASLAYDATALAAVLARTSYAQTGRVSFTPAQLANPNGFSGIDGIFRFTQAGIAERGLAVMELTVEGVQVIDRAPATFQAGPSL